MAITSSLSSKLSRNHERKIKVLKVARAQGMYNKRNQLDRMSKFQISRDSIIDINTSWNKLSSDTNFSDLLQEEYQLPLSKYTTFSVSEKTNLFATLNQLQFDLDIYIGRINPNTGKPNEMTNGYPLSLNSSTNPGKESESIFSVLEEGDYWLGIVANAFPDDSIEAFENATFDWSLDGKTFDETRTLSDDPLLYDQWHLFDTGITAPDSYITLSNQNVDIGAPEAWKLGFNADIPIAIIDQGVDINHPDLIDNLWTNPREIKGNGKDDDNNGYVDDIHGWNFVDNTPDVDPSNGHGTHVAGTVGAKGNNGIGVSGVAWNTQLMTLDVFGGKERTSGEIEAIRYAVDNGAKVINMSIGLSIKQSPTEFLKNPDNADYQEALQYAKDNDVFIAIAAANEGSQANKRNRYDGIGDLDEYTTFPAVYSQIFGNIVTVAALNAQSNLAEYSNYGQNASIIAPGGQGGDVILGQDIDGSYNYAKTDKTSILSTVPVGTGNVDNDGTVGTKKDYDYKSGTSMASPVIAGMAGLIRAENDEITALDTVAILRAGALKNAELKEVVNQGYQANLYQSLDIAQKWEGPDTLTGIGQDIAPVMNLSYLTTAQKLNGSLELTRDASLDTIIGFYQVLDVNGTIMDANGNALKPGDANYKSAALNAGNLIEDLNNLEVENDSSRSINYSLKGTTNGSYLAPFAITGDNTWFAWKEANSDGLDHFKVTGANQFSLDDQAGSNADRNFTDLIMQFKSSDITNIF